MLSCHIQTGSQLPSAASAALTLTDQAAVKQEVDS